MRAFEEKQAFVGPAVTMTSSAGRPAEVYHATAQIAILDGFLGGKPSVPERTSLFGILKVRADFLGELRRQRIDRQARKVVTRLAQKEVCCDEVLGGIGSRHFGAA